MIHVGRGFLFLRVGRRQVCGIALPMKATNFTSNFLALCVVIFGLPLVVGQGCQGAYALVFRQTVPFFYPHTFAGSLNQNDPSNDNFAILDRLSDFRLQDGRFQFQLVWPDSGEAQEWFQTSNPWTNTVVTGYSAIELTSTVQYWGGLERSELALSFIDGSVNHVNWYYAIGSTQSWKGGIPAYASNAGVRVAELYAWDECPTGEEDPNVCTQEEKDNCMANAVCSKSNGATNCTCWPGFEDDDGTCVDIDECAIEVDSSVCHHLAYCDNMPGAFQCVCPEGFLGNGYNCTSNSWSVRTVFQCDDVSIADVNAVKHAYSEAVAGMGLNSTNDMVETARVEVWTVPDQISVNALFYTEDEASARLPAVRNAVWSTVVSAGCVGAAVVDGPDVYAFVGRSTRDPLAVQPSGFEVEGIFFDASCLDSGCWVIDVVYTTGTNDFNAFYLPEAIGSDALSYDFDYSTADSIWSTQSPADTFLPNTHPCTSADYDAASGLLAQVSSCCLDQFFDMYRPIQAFVTAVGDDTGNCSVGPRDRPLDTADVRMFSNGELLGDGNAPAGVYVNGLFSGLNLSYGEARGVIDPFVGIHKARFYLDEVEIRNTAGRLSGTVGVEHTVDTFLGLINLSPTGTKVLDTFATQVAIRLEKTNFFTVSTQSTNDYTFLEYVNLRLVAIYKEDTDFSGVDESAAETVRTNASLAAHYVQVTFTLGAQYKINANTELVPPTSVRAGGGEFFDSATLAHKCVEWAGSGFADKGTFDERLEQTSCAPAAEMCTSPSSIPDSFVAYNIPLGLDFFGAASDTLSNNVFVDMVISATENLSNTPNNGDDPQQMKTTLTASIPVVEGGVNIFCDSYTAKTDLKDVANADIVVGSASTRDELSRLRIKKDIASTQLSASAITQIDSDSIEAGLMTLVLKGSDSYFAESNNPGRKDVSLELEDVITIHIMDSDGSGESTSVATSVMDLITQAPQDNSVNGSLDTDGYGLNGAFKFTIDRSAQRAHLEPTQALLEVCPFNPPRPANNAELETCVTRRDVRYRGFPTRVGASSTAMEICASDGSCATETTSAESAFFTTILGDNAYARQLAVNYAAVIATQYSLDGRYKRAFWVNPGYEWTPTQTGGTTLFSVSQKLFLFALITLDEGIATDDGTDSPSLSLPPLSRRRMLLQSTPEQALQDGQAGLNADAFEFQTTPTSMMAKAFKVPEDRVATFKVALQLTHAEACMSKSELQASIRATLEEHLDEAASGFHTVQVMSLAVHKAGVQCAQRRSLRALHSALSDASAEVTMMVVFKAGTTSTISLAKLQTMHGISSVEPLIVSPKVNTAVDESFVPPPAYNQGSSPNIGLIAGAAAGGAVVLIALAAAGMMFQRKQHDRQEAASAVHTINAADLKQQLAQDI